MKLAALIISTLAFLFTSAANAACLAPVPGDSAPAINTALANAGPGGIVYLCRSTLYPVQTTIAFQHADQMLATETFDTGNTDLSQRARITINSSTLVNAVMAHDVPGAWLKWVTVDGLADYWGRACCGALVDFGGSVTQSATRSQEIAGCEIREPRGWTALHVSAGNGGCLGVRVQNNDIGPAGLPWDWADGISYQCRDGVVTGNLVFDATDGGIVVFAAPGSVIGDNRIVAYTRELLGGINLVDPGPMRTAAGDGDFRGVKVANNLISATGAFIHIGVASGPNVWWPTVGTSGPWNVNCGDGVRNDGAWIYNNTLDGAYMGYGFAVDGVRNWTIENNVDNSTHVYTTTAYSCRQNSVPRGFQKYSPRSSGVFSGNSSVFSEAFLDYALGISY